jgi:hypothetical protein
MVENSEFFIQLMIVLNPFLEINTKINVNKLFHKCVDTKD